MCLRHELLKSQMLSIKQNALQHYHGKTTQGEGTESTPSSLRANMVSLVFLFTKDSRFSFSKLSQFLAHLIFLRLLCEST